MNASPLDEDRLQSASTAEIHRALFEDFVAGHAQMALMLLGQIENPDTGSRHAPDVAAAKRFIDQLEMLEVKTRGNLSGPETHLLRRSLRVTRDALAAVLDAGRDAG